MGQTLGEPITTKETASCADNRYKVGSSCMQGWRINMEDSHTHLLTLPDDHNAAFFAVYDGHGGARVSQYVSLHLHKRVVNSDLYAKGDYVEAMKQGFLQLDEQMLEDEETKEEMSGTTAITVLIKDSTIYCANVGDSRAVASVTGQALPLSYDHKPCNEEESQRIIAAGGWVEFNRVNGNLALSRALGDFGFKRNEHKSAQEQVVTAYPEVLKFDITPQFEFLVLACDDCEMSGLGCDNMTAIIVCLMQNDTQEKYLERLRVAAANSKDRNETANRGHQQAANKVVEEQMAELGLKPASELVVDVPLIDTDHSDEQFTTPSQSPNGHNSAQEPCSDDEQPPSHFHVPLAEKSTCEDSTAETMQPCPTDTNSDPKKSTS
uniref:protein-serine/threonine phosphatase n=1 Tax=Ditylenchus dipsaci TaxID=166011 RepID=A0A915DPW0_9BILA